VLFENREYELPRPRPPVGDPLGSEKHAGGAVREMLEQQFSLMDQEHGRIRSEALAARLRDREETTQLK